MTRQLVWTLLSLASLISPVGATWPLDAKGRAELDKRAQAQPRLTLQESKAVVTGAVPAFLLTALDLPSTEERRRSESAHAELLKRNKTLPAPAAAAKLLERLVQEVPPHQMPEEFRYTLTIVDRAVPEASTPGGGFVVASRGLIDATLADRMRGEAALAFLLARQIGHSALGHCRRGWQRVLLEEDAKKGINDHTLPGTWRSLLETKVNVSGRYVEFLYSLNQEYRADLFAISLCRNAGIDLDQAIDGMRFLASRSEKDQALHRLKRLLQERDGEADPEAEFGLFVWDRTRRDFTRCKPGDVGKDAKPIVFVHGLYGTSESWNTFLSNFAEQRSLDGRPLLVFRHPGNGSLARSSLMLSKQVKLLLPSPTKATFICHSAGGLAFRWYTEKLGGEFDRVVMMATPHLGSNLTQLKFLVDLQEFLEAARFFGLNQGIERVVAEGRGEIGQDLHPDSLFLRALGTNRPAAKRYHVFYGEWLAPQRARLAEVAFLTLSKSLEPRFGPALPEGILRRQAERLVASLVLPAEIIKGDCIVSSRSANLSGAGSTTKLKLRHLAFRTDEEAIRLVLASITR